MKKKFRQFSTSLRSLLVSNINLLKHFRKHIGLNCYSIAFTSKKSVLSDKYTLDISLGAAAIMKTLLHDCFVILRNSQKKIKQQMPRLEIEMH